jgi:SAM-dependent methyltransferase
LGAALPPLAPNAQLRWAVVRRFLANTAPSTVLEIGCGQGAFGARLALRAEYLGVEPDATSFALAKKRIESAGGLVRNVTSDAIGSDRLFDMVCAFEVLEHLEDDRAAADSWGRLVTPGGHLMISMPAWQHRFNSWDNLVGHYRRYSPFQVLTLLEEAGFTDVQVVVYGWPLGYVLEKIRSRIAGRQSMAGVDTALSMQERTAGSGRILQPKVIVGKMMRIAVLPCEVIQRLRPSAGTGLVAVGRRPMRSNQAYEGSAP